MKILVLGANGQLGKAWMRLARSDAFPIGWTLTGWGRDQGDLSSPDLLLERVRAFSPDLIVNAAAYTQVDRAETDREACEAANATSPARLAAYCAERRVPFVHYSTDYVYAGTGDRPFGEDAPYASLNFYGETKARGDAAIAKSACDHLVFRTSWVYSHEGKNFVLTMLRLGAERPELKVVEDQIGAPTYAPDLALYSLGALKTAMEREVFPSGIYHLTNAGSCSWKEFAQAILPGKPIAGIPSSDYPTPAKRPLNSRLSLNKFETTFGIRPRAWKEALRDCLAEIRKEGADRG